MKMLKNGLEVDASVTSRIPIPSPRSTKRVDVPRYAAPPPARLVPDPHVEDGAVAEHADGAEPVDEVVVYKNRDLSSPVPKNVWPLSIRDGTQTQTHHDSTIITSTEDQGWEGTIRRGYQKRLQVVDTPGYVEDPVQGRRTVRQTTSGQLQTPVSRQWY